MAMPCTVLCTPGARLSSSCRHATQPCVSLTKTRFPHSMLYRQHRNRPASRKRCRQLMCFAQRDSKQLHTKLQSEKSDMVHAEIIYFMFQLASNHSRCYMLFCVCYMHQDSSSSRLVAWSATLIEQPLFAEPRYSIAAHAEYGRL